MCSKSMVAQSVHCAILVGTSSVVVLVSDVVSTRDTHLIPVATHCVADAWDGMHVYCVYVPASKDVLPHIVVLSVRPVWLGTCS